MGGGEKEKQGEKEDGEKQSSCRRGRQSKRQREVDCMLSSEMINVSIKLIISQI